MGTHTEAQYRHETHAGIGSAGLHSHAGAWERGEVGELGNPWFPRSSVGTHTEAKYKHETHAGTETPVCIPTPDRGNEADAQYNLLP